MKIVCLAFLVFALLQPRSAAAQTIGAPSSEPGQAASAFAKPESPTPGPVLIPVAGTARTANDEPRTGQATLRLSLYATEDDPTPLWIEDQIVTLGPGGVFQVWFGSTQPEGLPARLFTESSAKWLGITIDQDPELPRTVVVAFPYAARAASADALGTKSATDFVLSENLAQIFKEWGVGPPNTPKTPAEPGAPEIQSLSTGETTTPNALAKYLDNIGTLGEAPIFATGGTLGIGTTTPASRLEIGDSAGNEYLTIDAGSTTGNEAGIVFQQGGSTGMVAGYVAGATSTARQFRISGAANLASNVRVAVQQNGFVGIGTTTPATAMDVHGKIRAVANGTATPTSGKGLELYTFTDDISRINSVDRDAASVLPLYFAASRYLFQTGYVGIGALTGASVPLLVKSSGSNLDEISLEHSGNTVKLASLGQSGGHGSVVIRNNSGVIQTLLSAGGNSYVAAGNVGIGTTTPSDKLHVSGNALITGNSAVSGNTNVTGASTTGTLKVGGTSGIEVTRAGTYLVVGGDLRATGTLEAKYQDVAEWVDASEPLPPATVVAAHPTLTNQVRRSTRAYDTTVLGVVSYQPGLLLGEKGEDRVAVAQSGRVKVRVDARYGAVKPGDLLVASPQPGIAMRSRPTSAGTHRPGTILGKALEALPSGASEILVLLTLQ